MDNLTEFDTENLIYEIATRARTAKQLAGAYDTTVAELRAFVKEHAQDIAKVAKDVEQQSEEDGEPTPNELSGLWVSNKGERLVRYQEVVDKLFEEFKEGSRDATVLRELRFYMQAVANELGQLLHRGSGESGSDSLSVDIQGVSLDNLR